ncbi:hypothetical protein HDU85_000655 [Gaertneriomyces sp. JEL0708]|nr:hypothetical protein HDU85_000655 [Gaertneriomyces sp. JEL0708]
MSLVPYSSDTESDSNEEAAQQQSPYQSLLPSRHSLQPVLAQPSASTTPPASTVTIAFFPPPSLSTAPTPSETLIVSLTLPPTAHHAHHLWPSSFVLSSYLSHHRHLLAGRKVLELGCGLALPGILAAKLGANVRCCDLEMVLEDVRQNVIGNGLVAVMEDVVDESECVPDPIGTVVVRPYPVSIRRCIWGVIPPFLTSDRLSKIILDNLYAYDLIIASDIFYSSAEYPDIMATIAYFLHYDPGSSAMPPPYGRQFITTYQMRSSHHTIQHLVDIWGLKARIVSKKDFGGWGDGWTILPPSQNGHVDVPEVARSGNSRIPREVGSVVLLIIEKA